MGHARAILGISDPAAQLQLYEAILKYDYSVRKIEEMARFFNKNGNFDAKNITETSKVSNLKEIDEIKERLGEIFGADVKFSCNNNWKGKISISFKNDTEMIRIMDLLDKIK